LAHEADAGRVHATRQRHGHLAGGDQLGGKPERRAPRAAREDHGLLGAGRPVAARDDVGMREGQDGPQRGPEPRVVDPLALAAPEPPLGFQHAAPDAADDHRRRAQLRARQARVLDGLVHRRHSEPVCPRAARRHAGKDGAGGNLGADASAERSCRRGRWARGASSRGETFQWRRGPRRGGYDAGPGPEPATTVTPPPVRR
jgi:hypothetical protein